MSKLKKFVIFLIFNVLVVCIALIAIEGVSSLVLFTQAVTDSEAVPERQHTKYDELLGWVALPNVYIENMYGPGIFLQTNSQSFRNDYDFTVNVAEGKLRLICSGDSFTLGYGVDNNQNWCQVLTAIDPQLETINMGQGGYGVDQAYLWYKRDGVKFDHHVHIFAFIGDDFLRMQRNSYFGYGKPQLRVRNGSLIIDNVPVPRRSYFVPWLADNQDAINNLRSVKLLRETFFQDVDASAVPAEQDEELMPELVAANILEDLYRLNQSKNSELLLVFFPTGRDLDQPEPATELWRYNVQVAANNNGIPLLDLVDDFRKLSPDQAKKMFLPDHHFSEEGNKFVAQLLYQTLLELPQVEATLSEP